MPICSAELCAAGDDDSFNDAEDCFCVIGYPAVLLSLLKCDALECGGVFMSRPAATIAFRDRKAPYKGIWVMEDQGCFGVRAQHSTYCRDAEPGCVIEQRTFDSALQASKFVRHLMSHGWSPGVTGSASAALLNVLFPTGGGQP